MNGDTSFINSWRDGTTSLSNDILRQTAFSIDHIIELKLIEAALNKLEPEHRSKYSEEDIKDLILYFNKQANLQVIGANENQKKSNAIKRLIHKYPAEGDDIIYVDQVRKKWKNIMKSIPNFRGKNKCFINLVTEILYAR